MHRLYDLLSCHPIAANLSLTGKTWRIRDEHITANTVKDFIHRISAERGLNDLLHNTKHVLSSPMEFPEMGRAVDRINQAIANNERITIFGDYDADGMTSAALLVRALRRKGVEPHVHLPHREKEGYGIRTHHIDTFAKEGTHLLLTVDTGIASHKEITHANDNGIDVIVTDHHSPQAGRPDAFAVIHPMIPAAFPNPYLSGAGVAFMLVRALESDDGWRGIEEDFLLATIGTVADLMPLTGENRTLVQFGLSFAKRLPKHSALRALCGENISTLASDDIAFRIAPLLNASGRLAHPSLGLSALLDGGKHVDDLRALNDERKLRTAELCEHARTTINNDDLFLMSVDADYHAGLVGLIAAHLTQSFGRPSMAGAIDGDVCTASLRSVPAVDLTLLLGDHTIAPLLTTWGGHAHAAGCTFDVKNAEGIREACNAWMRNQHIADEDLQPMMDADGTIAINALTTANVEAMNALAPFGMDNQEPIFVLPSVRLEDCRVVGEDGRHLQCRIGEIKAIAFNYGEFLDTVANQYVDIACSIQIDTWNNTKKVQLMIKDIRIGEQPV